MKTVARHVWQDYLERPDDVRLSPYGQQTFARRKETSERVFANAKEKYGMRYTNYNGLAWVINGVRL